MIPVSSHEHIQRWFLALTKDEELPEHTGDTMLTEANLKEIFCAFIATDRTSPSPDLFTALADASGDTVPRLKELYRAYSAQLTGRMTDPFEDYW